MISHLFAICLIAKERHYQLPSVPARGHGIVLLIFFTLIFIRQNLSLVNINSKDWWFDMNTKYDRIEMALFVTRYICTLFIFVLGLKAPGIASIASEDEELLVTDNAVSFDLNCLRSLILILISSGKRFNIQRLVEENANFDAVPLAKERFCSPTARNIMLRLYLCRSLHQPLRSNLQQKDCRLAFHPQRLSLGLDSDLCRLQVFARRRHWNHGIAQQPPKFPVDSDPTVHNQND